jgi:hypothetical protein
MLDLDHPQTEHIFTAAGLEEAVLDGAKRIVAAQPSERRDLLARCEERIDRMHTLNSEHFEDSPSINQAINELRDALRVLAASDSPQLNLVLPAFTKLESDDGFGTWMI